MPYDLYAMLLYLLTYTDILLPIVVGLIGSGGGAAAVATLYKLRPEAGQILITAAQGALVVQTGVLTSLKTEVDRLDDELKEERVENAKLGLELKEVRKENVSLRLELEVLKQQIQVLSKRTTNIETHNG
jgi:hypothetical protein